MKSIDTTPLFQILHSGFPWVGLPRPVLDDSLSPLVGAPSLPQAILPDRLRGEHPPPLPPRVMSELHLQSPYPPGLQQGPGGPL